MAAFFERVWDALAAMAAHLSAVIGLTKLPALKAERSHSSVWFAVWASSKILLNTISSQRRELQLNTAATALSRCRDEHCLQEEYARAERRSYIGDASVLSSYGGRSMRAGVSANHWFTYVAKKKETSKFHSR